MSKMAKIINESDFVMRWVEKDEIKEVFQKYCKEYLKVDILLEEFEFQNDEEETDELHLSFKGNREEVLEKIFFDEEFEGFKGVGGDCGRLIIAEAIAYDIEVSSSEVAVFADLANDDYLYIELPLRVFRKAIK